MAMTPLKGGNTPNLNTVLQSNPGDRVSPDSGGKVAPIVAVMARQMPLPQAQQLAGQTVLVRVAKSGPGDNAELEFNGQRIPVKMPAGKNLTAGEMITVAFALNDQENSESARETRGSRKSLDVNRLLMGDQTDGEGESSQSKSPSFVDKLSSSARLIGLLERLGQPRTNGAVAQATSQSRPMAALLATDTIVDMDGNPIQTKPGGLGATDAAKSATQAANVGNTASAALNPAQASRQLSGLLAQQVSQAVETSGLFYESHLQQWANGERSKSQLSLEPQVRFGAEQVISEKSLDPNAIGQSVRMVAQQLSTLDQSRINVAMQGLFQQPVEIQIEPDREREQQEEHEGEQSRPWVAKLKLDMPHLGPIEARIRISGQRMDLLLIGQAGSKALVDQHWNDIQTALEAKGLQLTHGQMRVSESLDVKEDVRG